MTGYVIRFRSTFGPFVCFQEWGGVGNRILRSTRTESTTAVWDTPEKARAWLRAMRLDDGARVPVGVGSYVAEVVTMDPADYAHPRNCGALFESPAELLRHAETVKAEAFYARFAIPEPAPTPPTKPTKATQAVFAFD